MTTLLFTFSINIYNRENNQSRTEFKMTSYGSEISQKSVENIVWVTFNPKIKRLYQKKYIYLKCEEFLVNWYYLLHSLCTHLNVKRVAQVD